MATSGHAAADGDADDADGADDSGEEQRPKKAAKKDTAQELNGARIFTIAQDAASPVALRYPSSANVAKLKGRRHLVLRRLQGPRLHPAAAPARV